MDIRTTVAICDDHAVVRSALRALLEIEPDFHVIAEAASADDAVKQVRVGRPDVLVLDLMMPGRTGIEALPEIIAASPRTGVLVLSMQDDPVYVRQAFASGAHGYLLKEAAGAELVQAIRDVAAGLRYVHPLLGARLAQTEAVSSGHPAIQPLSAREREVFRLLALGNTNHEIAELLAISVRTAETHRARIMQKLGLRTRAEIVRYALAAGDLDVASRA